MRKMKIIPDGVRHALNEAVHIPKSRMKVWLKNKCDALDRKQRFRVVAVAFTVFMLTTLYIFGNACYRIGKGCLVRKSVDRQIQHFLVKCVKKTKNSG
ncbi:TraL conjugative transposon family protein, partial [Phocaeicola sartorii]|uniref:TraL conjugative transposon family protein n=1 Tax=Phocaeicola sartorii TaxID=671267 RepID=UPI0013639FE2